MHVIKFLFKYVEAINPMAFDEDEGTKLWQEMKNKYDSVPLNTEDPNFKDDLKYKAVKFFNNPYVRFILGGAFVIVVKYTKDWINGKYDDHQDEVTQ